MIHLDPGSFERNDGHPVDSPEDVLCTVSLSPVEFESMSNGKITTILKELERENLEPRSVEPKTIKGKTGIQILFNSKGNMEESTEKINGVYTILETDGYTIYIRFQSASGMFYMFQPVLDTLLESVEIVKFE